MNLTPCDCPHHRDESFYHYGDCCQTCPFCGQARIRLDDIYTHAINCPKKIAIDREKILGRGLFSD